MLLQMPGAREKQPERFFGIFQAFYMCEETAGFDGEQELRRNLDAPALECRFAWKPVEAVVEFHCIEVPDKILQPV